MPDLGKKHACPSCGIKFYDLGKSEPVCPKCGVNVRKSEEKASAPSTKSAPKRRKAEAPKDLDEDAAEAQEELLDDEDDEEELGASGGEDDDEDDDDEDDD